MPNKSAARFPKRFLWGVSTSAHQVEGNTHNQWSEWELHNAQSLATQAPYQYGDLENWSAIKSSATNPKNYVSGSAADHYLRYEDDFRLARKLNMNSFRFSIEWSRVEPRNGQWNQSEIDHYKRYVRVMKKNGLEPVVTLFHFTIPVWFAELGGFAKRKNVKLFVRFAQKMILELGISVQYIITINEPEVYAYQSYVEGEWPPQIQSRKKFFFVLNNLALAHRQASKAIHALNRRYKVSVAKNSAYIYSGDDAIISRKSADVLQYLQDDFFLKKVVRHCDFLGVNYYFSDRVYGYRRHNPDERVSDLGWDMSPANLEYALERLWKKYKLPIIITENGVADASDQHRKWWLTHTLVAMQRALAAGVQLEGYLHWSLIDNFEWDKGFWPQFGLASVDYKTMERTLRPSSIWFGKTIRKLRGI